jgi:hypothetical protein
MCGGIIGFVSMAARHPSGHGNEIVLIADELSAGNVVAADHQNATRNQTDATTRCGRWSVATP